MTAAVKQKARIARVRRLQHGLAASGAAAAAGQLRNLETSRERLAQMRIGLSASQGETSGALLSAAGELAMRLDAARLGLAPTIEAARSAAAAREQARIQARREQESAERLEQAAASAAEASAERRINKSGRRRGGLRMDEVLS
jgi:hypothetical protein